jgi:DNA-binding NarL/FixJ family response regulator
MLSGWRDVSLQVCRDGSLAVMDYLQLYRTVRSGWSELDSLLAGTPYVFAVGSPMLAMALVQTQCAAVGRVGLGSGCPQMAVYGEVWARGSDGTQRPGMFAQTGCLLGVVTTADEALALCRAHRPRLLLCTEVLEQGDGVSLIEAAKMEVPGIRTILALQNVNRIRCQQAHASSSDGIMAEALVGRGFVLQALTTVLGGGIYLDPEIQAILCQQPVAGDAGLSERELDVMQAVLRGDSSARIASELQISVNTVKFHLKQVFQKLGVNSRTEAAVQLLQMGLLRP